MALTLTKVGHSVREQNGRQLILPPNPPKNLVNLRMPDIETPSTLQLYPLGTIFREGDRSYRYAKASGGQIPDVGSQIGSHQHVENCAVQANYAAGVTTITITTASTAGAAHNGLIAEDELYGGYIVVFPAGGNKAFVRQIIGNSACTISQANTCTIKLDRPTPVAITTSDTAECMASPYLNVITGANERRAVVGVPACVATTGQYFWLQTWGPCWCATEANLGNSANNIGAKWRYNGTLQTADDADAYHECQQYAGFVLSFAYAGTQGAPFVWLQIAY